MIERLSFLAANGRLAMLAAWLADPARPLTDCPAAGRLRQPFQRLEALLAQRPDLVGLLELRLVTDWLLGPARLAAETGDWLRGNGLMARWLPAAAAAPGARARWICIPVLLAGSRERAVVRHLIAGRLQTDEAVPLLAPWAQSLCDREAQGAIATAARLAGSPETVFHVFPLLAPGNHLVLGGASLGLPLAVGLWQLGTGADFPPGVALTGVLADDGTLGPVRALAAKCQAAGARGFGHLVYPKANRPPEGRTDLCLYSAAEWNEAAILALLAGQDQSGALRTFARMLADAGAFVAHCAGVPADWIEWAARNQRLDAVRAQILADPDLLGDLARQVQKLTEAGRTAEATSLCRLVPPGTAQTLEDPMLESAFCWAVNCLDLANRRGQVIQAAAWDQAGAALFQRACGGGSPEAMARHANSAFVHREQGRYHFSPPIPVTLEALLRRFARRAEEDRAMGCPVHPVLGALCGTLAQHYGFCGPGWIESCEAHVRQAQRAFGDETVPGRRRDWLRPLNYLCYARLDAGDLAGAESALMAYLESAGWDALLEKADTLDRWQHALLARFLADAGPRRQTRRYLEWGATFFKTAPEGHPWQLWANNLGRVAQRENEPEAAERYYRSAVQRCRDSAWGPTVQVMALMPLAGLDGLGVLDPLELAEAVAAVREAALHLDHAHFRPVFEMDPAGLLALVRDQPRRLFPFAYR